MLDVVGSVQYSMFSIVSKDNPTNLDKSPKYFTILDDVINNSDNL